MIHSEMTAEQFGTDLRATATTSIPTFFRSGLMLYSPIFQWLVPMIGYAYASYALGMAVMACSMTAAWGLRETFAIDMDYLEVPAEKLSPSAHKSAA